ncbi:hypothetical protein J3A83DRAFT_4087709 [Scleroderma citrinum]
MLTWKQSDKDLGRIKSNLVDLGYHFPKQMMLASMLTPARKKTYLLNWLCTCLLWISQVNVHQPTKFLSPQMWRDFLNTIDTDQPNQLTSTKSALRKSAVWNILGDQIIQSAQGLAGVLEEVMWQGMQVRILSFLDPYLSIHVLCRFNVHLFQIHLHVVPSMRTV